MKRQKRDPSLVLTTHKFLFFVTFTLSVVEEVYLYDSAAYSSHFIALLRCL